MTVGDKIREWQRGCSCASPGRPWECEACTRALHEAIDGALGLEDGGQRVEIKFDQAVLSVRIGGNSYFDEEAEAALARLNKA